MQTSSFLSILNGNFQNMPLDCPTIIIGDCDINMLGIRIESKYYKIGHIWTNAPTQKMFF
jgi:hypothetical protein